MSSPEDFVEGRSCKHIFISSDLLACIKLILIAILGKDRQRALHLCSHIELIQVLPLHALVDPKGHTYTSC